MGFFSKDWRVYVTIASVLGIVVVELSALWNSMLGDTLSERIWDFPLWARVLIAAVIAILASWLIPHFVFKKFPAPKKRDKQ